MTAMGVALLLGLVGMPPDLPVVVIRSDNTRIDRSCRVVIEPGTVIIDADGNGVVHVDTDGVTLEFDEDRGQLWGASPDRPWNQHEGIGIRIEGARDVTIRGARLHGFRAGIVATSADGLTIEQCDVSDGYRARLGSTPQAEDTADWLWPHANDGREWLTRYGAGIYVARSAKVTIRDCFARRRQNGIVLDRVVDSRVYDNDCSFLSGWGLALWRSSRNIITRNAFDFCVRGYSHGVYNRGQDSAGILLFEQCSGNIIAANSATHGGDGLFAFGGREALGEVPPPQAGFDYTRRGNNDNLIVGNDFSYAAAHGLELTFSFGNRIINNRLEGNAICGIWGGYSQETLIAGNVIVRNGEMGYALERGGVNIEHGRANRIEGNRFEANACGVHLWWDEDRGLLRLPWAAANTPPDAPRPLPSLDNTIRGNLFHGDELAVHLRNCDRTWVGDNQYQQVGRVIEVDSGSEPVEPTEPALAAEEPELVVLGRSQPVGARRELRGREHIIVGPWGPWDHAEPMVRLARTGAGRAGDSSQPMTRIYEIFGRGGVWRYEDLLTGERVTWPVSPTPDEPLTLTIVARRDVHPYAYRISTDGWATELRGTIVSARWEARFFSWTEATDPRQDLAGWRALASGPAAVTVAELPTMELVYGHGGPRDQPWAGDRREQLPGPDRFGMIATARLTLPAGTWNFTTLSDDGVRVTVNGQVVVENWTWHPPTRDRGQYQQAQPGPVELVVEHFEIDGYAVLTLQIEEATVP